MRGRQLWAVFRLEIAKSFFSRRGLWIYLLALAPLLIFVGHSYEAQVQHARSARRAKANPNVTRAKMGQVRNDMTREEVVALLGEPADTERLRRRRPETEYLYYSDGAADLAVRIEDGRVRRSNIREMCNFGEDLTIFAGVFQFFYLRLAIFFGCMFVFMNLFRGEILDKSLHFYFLAPVRREVVVAGKFLAGLTATVVIFGLSMAAQLTIFNAHFTPVALENYVGRGDAMYHALAYVGVTALACAGYGSVFLAAGVLLRNPLIPAAAILLWESINGVLPQFLRQFSVIYYLKSLCPVEIPIDRGVPPPIAMLALNVDPAPAALAIGGLLAVGAGLVSLASWKARKLEINYGTE